MTVLSTADRVCAARIQKPPDRDGFTPTSGDWKDVVPRLMVKLRPAGKPGRPSGREIYVDPGYQSLFTHTMESSFDSRVKPTMRAVYAGRFFHIEAVLNVAEKSIDMVMDVTELI